MYLIAEFCDADFYAGWHLYYRDNKSFERNNNGGWGWIRRISDNKAVIEFLESLGITIKGDGTCDDDGIAEFARRFPLKGKKCGGRIRGGVEIERVDGKITLVNVSKV